MQRISLVWIDAEQELLSFKTLQQRFFHIFVHLVTSRPMFVESSYHEFVAVCESLQCYNEES